jgi:hypothetical protein
VKGKEFVGMKGKREETKRERETTTTTVSRKFTLKWLL